MTLKTKQEGFTIVELLIVIVVIIILAGLVLVTFNGVQQKARNTERTTDIKAIESHLETYNAQNGKYPTLADMNTQPGTGNWWIQDNLKGLDKEALRDPKNSSYQLAATPTASQYAYQPTDDGGNACDNTATDCSKFTLTAKQEGGGADIVQKSLQ